MAYKCYCTEEELEAEREAQVTRMKHQNIQGNAVI